MICKIPSTANLPLVFGSNKGEGSTVYIYFFSEVFFFWRLLKTLLFWSTALLQLCQKCRDTGLYGQLTDGTIGTRGAAVCTAGEMTARQEDQVLLRLQTHPTHQFGRLRCRTYNIQIQFLLRSFKISILNRFKGEVKHSCNIPYT